ncbi:MAG: P-loop NTPase fold protein [Marinomonas sp.]
MNNTKPAFTDCATDGKRKELAERFTHYLKSRKTEKNAYVVNLNGAWGTGKTYFVTEWKKLVEEQGHIAVKIDAWESDYLNDPLAIIIAELLEQVRDRIENYDKDFEDKEKEVANAILNIGKDILPILAKILGKHLLGKAATDDIASLLGKATGSLLSNEKLKDDLNIGELGLSVVRQHKQHKQFTQDFKKQARDLVDFALEGNPNKQVFVFIDELDRCRPTYAIEMLETVKHLFDIPNFIFVLSTDTNQLQHSIKAVYGHDFDSHEYLSRFFEQRLTLPEPDFFEFLTAEGIFDKDDFQALPTLPAIETPEQLRAAVALICEQNKPQLSLRRVKQICAQLEVVLDSKKLRENAYPIFTLIGLVFGNALYGGWSKPESPLKRALLALQDSQHPERIFNKFEVFTYKVERQVANNTVNCEALISTTLDVMKRLITSKPSAGIFGGNHTSVQFRKRYFELIPIGQSELLTTRSELHKLYSPTNIIADGPRLFEIIENLNILSETSEE